MKIKIQVIYARYCADPVVFELERSSRDGKTICGVGHYARAMGRRWKVWMEEYPEFHPMKLESHQVTRAKRWGRLSLSSHELAQLK